MQEKASKIFLALGMHSENLEIGKSCGAAVSASTAACASEKRNNMSGDK
jgi:hypothetical protein